MKARPALLLALLALAACQASGTLDTASRPGDNSALSTMERVAVSAQSCWFAGGREAFAGLSMSPELTSHSGKPRILAVPRGNIGGLPRLIVEASGNPARLEAYGPLMDGPDRERIAADIRRWAARDARCSAGA